MPRRNKYGVSSKDKRTYRGRVYASALEMRHAMVLDSLIASGEVKSWQYEKRLPLLIDGEKVCEYRPDFWVIYADGHIEIWEAKGKLTAYSALKYKVFRATWLKEHPDVTFRINPIDA